MVEILEDGEARRREAVGNDGRKQEAAAERARKSQKASRDKKSGRKAAEEALLEDTAGETSSCKVVQAMHVVMDPPVKACIAN